MQIVTEIISSEPLDRPHRTIKRDEGMLFQAPPAPAMRFLTAGLPPLAVYTIPVVYEELPFARPKGVFEGPSMRLEWQMMDGRQPFYHRNADVDEIGFQICGDRTLITECGTVDFAPGQFSRIPLGVAHDNFGREDIHLIFYLHGPVTPGIAPVRLAEHRERPFPGWEAKPMVEAITNAMGAPGGSIGYSMVDESLLLDAARNFPDRLEVLEPGGTDGTTEWVYRAPKIWIGHTRLQPGTERRYRRHICADEIQFQISGRRTIVSQRGVVTLEPGDFTCIPRGCAYASLARTPSRHLSALTLETVPPTMEASRHSDPDVAAWLAAQSDVVPEPLP